MFRLNQIPESNYVIAGAIGIAPTTLSCYARGTKPISAKHLPIMCQFFQCEPEDIMGTMEVEAL